MYLYMNYIHVLKQTNVYSFSEYYADFNAY